MGLVGAVREPPLQALRRMGDSWAIVWAIVWAIASVGRAMPGCSEAVYPTPIHHFLRYHLLKILSVSQLVPNSQ